MSLILDALRKSEAERRRGQAPDLYAELPPVARRPRGVAQPWWWLAAALALGALLAWGVSQRSPAPMPTAIAPATSTVDPQRRSVEVRVMNRADNPSASISDTPAAVIAAPPLSSPSEVVVAPAGIATAPTNIAPPLQEPKPVPGTAWPDAREASIAAPAAAAPPPSPTPPLVPATTRVQPAPPPASPFPSSAAPATPVTDGNAPITLSDLSATERQQLPPLKVSMHLWASTPAERFVIVDGLRVGEGDRVGEAFVESITRDGLVLAWNGRRLRVRIR